MFSISKFNGIILVRVLRQKASYTCAAYDATQQRNFKMSFHLSQRDHLHQRSTSNHNTDSTKRGRQWQDDMRLMTIPNLLTSARIVLTPAIGYYIWHGMHSYALACFTVAAVTDLLDGFIARRFNQGSKVGAILDPLADKFLLVTCFIALYHANLMPHWLVGGFIIRDLGLMCGGALLRYRSFPERTPSVKQFFDFNQYPAAQEFEPTFVSKCNTALQCLLILTHLTTHNQTGTPAYDLSISALHMITATTTVVSLGQYAKRASKSKLLVSVEKKKST